MPANDSETAAAEPTQRITAVKDGDSSTASDDRTANEPQEVVETTEVADEESTNYRTVDSTPDERFPYYWVFGGVVFFAGFLAFALPFIAGIGEFSFLLFYLAAVGVMFVMWMVAGIMNGNWLPGFVLWFVASVAFGLPLLLIHLTLTTYWVWDNWIEAGGFNFIEYVLVWSTPMVTFAIAIACLILLLNDPHYVIRYEPKRKWIVKQSEKRVWVRKTIGWMKLPVLFLMIACFVVSSLSFVSYAGLSYDSGNDRQGALTID